MIHLNIKKDFIVSELCDKSLGDYLERIYPKGSEKKEIPKIFY